jgi:predicted glycosyltransferase
VLGTAGGGGDGFELMRAYAQALKLWPASSVYSVIVLGPLMPPQQSEAFQAALGKDGDVELVDYTTNLVPSLRAASLIVSMAGYNTTAEIIAERKPAILVPRAAPRAEQLLRARQLAALGLVRMVEPDGDLPARLAELVPAALNAASAAEWERLDLGGAGRVATLLQDKFTCRDDAALGDNLT